MEIQLREYQAILQKLNAHGRHTLTNVIKQCKYARSSFDLMYECQARLGELVARLSAVNSDVIKFKLPLVQYYQSIQNLGPIAATPGRSFSRSSKSRGRIKSGITSSPNNSLPGVPTQDTIEFASLFNGDEQEINSKHKSADVMILEKKLDISYDENEELAMELFEAQQGKDKTPAALLFYSALHDPGLIVSMQQLAQQLGKLRGIIDCSVHFDFLMLRKRLLVCLNAVPSVEKFIERFSSLHKQWTKVRYNTFLSRKQTGKDADAAHVCPMCTFDWRQASYEENKGYGKSNMVGDVAVLNGAIMKQSLSTALLKKDKNGKKKSTGLQQGSTFSMTLPGISLMDDSRDSTPLPHIKTNSSK